jgi:hypothetical protein
MDGTVSRRWPTKVSPGGCAGTQAGRRSSSHGLTCGLVGPVWDQKSLNPKKPLNIKEIMLHRARPTALEPVTSAFGGTGP